MRPTVVVFDHSPNKTISYQDLQDDKVELTIDKAKGFAFKVDDIHKAQNDINVLNEASQDGGEQMKIGIERTVLGTIFSDAKWNRPQTVLDKNNITDWIVDNGTPLTEVDIPRADRWLLIPPKAEAMMLKSPVTQSAQIMGDPVTVLRKRGWLGTLGGFEIFISNLLPTVNGVTYCMAGHKNAVTFASQLDKIENLRLQDQFGDAVRGLNVFGYKTLLPHGLVTAPVTFS